jgi:cyanate permease
MLIQCWLIYFCFGLVSTTLSVIVTPVRNDLNLSYSQMGFILGTWQLVYTVVAIPLGFLIDRIGIYKSLVLASIIISVSAVLRSFAVNFETLTIFVALFGIGGSMVSVSIPKLASTWFRGSERGTATGIYATGGIIGGIAALSLTNSVVIPLVGNWRNAYIIYGFVTFLIAMVWLFLGRRSPGLSDPMVVTVPVKGKGFSGLREAFSKNVWLVVIIGITAFLVGHGLSQWFPTILQANGMTATEAGFAVSMVSVFAIFGSLLAPALPHLVGSKKLAISVLLLIQGISLLTISEVTGPILWIILALRGLSGGFMPLLSLVLMDLPEVGPERMGMVGGVFFAAGEIGGFGGPVLMGLFKDITGNFSLGLILLAVVCEAMILPTVFLRVDEKPKKT